MIFFKENASEWFDYWYKILSKKDNQVSGCYTLDCFGEPTIKNFVEWEKGPDWIGLRSDDHHLRSGSLILPYTGKLSRGKQDARLYVFFTSRTAGGTLGSVSYEDWCKAPEVVDFRMRKMMEEILNQTN